MGIGRLVLVSGAVACMVGSTSFVHAHLGPVSAEYQVAQAAPDSLSLGSAEDHASRTGGATAWSALATLVPVTLGIVVGAAGDGGTRQTITSATLLWGGAIVGPAAGYWYGGAGGSATPGLIIRGAAFLMAAVLAPTDDLDDGIYPNPDLDDAAPWVLASAVILVSDVIDILSVDGAVRRAESKKATALPYFDGRDREIGLVVSAAW